MTQAELFRKIASAGIEGGIAAGESLPDEAGMMGGIRVFEIEAAPRMSMATIVNNLIESLGQKPIHNIERRCRQLEALFNIVYREYQHIVIVFRNAHAFPPSTIKYLKKLHEFCDGPYSGIVLLGDLARLSPKINAHPEISMRTAKFSGGKELAIWPVKPSRR